MEREGSDGNSRSYEKGKPRSSWTTPALYQVARLLYTPCMFDVVYRDIMIDPIPALPSRHMGYSIKVIINSVRTYFPTTPSRPPPFTSRISGPPSLADSSPSDDPPKLSSSPWFSDGSRAQRVKDR